MDKQTSDERLLKIIEGSSEGRRVQNTVRETKRSFGHPKQEKFNFSNLKNVFKDLKLNLFKVNTVLIGSGVLLTVIFIFTLFSGPAVSKSNAAYFVAADSDSVARFITTGEAQGLIRKNIDSENLRRNFFLPPSAKGSDLLSERGASLEELKGFKLVGIVWSDNPEVMIENSGDGRTYIFKKGESFNDQFKIKEISRNAATLEINSGNGVKEYELR